MPMPITSDETAYQNLLKTPQSLIHIRHEMTLIQYKYWLLILHYAMQVEAQEIETKETVIGKMYSIPFGYLANYIGYYPDARKLKDDLEALRKYNLIYNLMQKDKQDIMNLSEQIQSEDNGVVYYSGLIGVYGVVKNAIHVEVPSILINLMKTMLKKENSNNIFQILNWDIYNKFPSKYTSIIYKMCRDYLGIGFVKSQSIEEFRNYIGLNEKDYPEFKLLNHHIIKTSIREINESDFSDIIVGVDYIRSGRFVTHLRFKVMKKETNNIPVKIAELPSPSANLDIKDDKELTEVALLVRDNALSPSVLKKHIAKFGFAYVQATLIRANRRADENRTKNPNEPMNYGAWYTNAFKNNFGGEELEEQLLKEQQLKKQRELDEKKAKAKAEKAAAEAKLKAEQEAEVQEKMNLWRRLPESVQNEIWRDVCSQKRKNIIVEHLVRDWEAAQTQDDKNAVLAHGRYRNVFLKFVEPYIENGIDVQSEQEADNDVYIPENNQPEPEKSETPATVSKITTQSQSDNERIMTLYGQLGKSDIEFLLDELKARLTENGKERLIKLADNLVSQNLPLYHSTLLADDFFTVMKNLGY